MCSSDLAIRVPWHNAASTASGSTSTQISHRNPDWQPTRNLDSHSIKTPTALLLDPALGAGEAGVRADGSLECLVQIEARQVQENPGEAVGQADDVPGSTPVPPQISWMHVGPYLGLLAVLWSWAVWIDAGFWSTNDNYSYGWIVPPLMLFFLWRRVQSQPEAFWTGLEIGRAHV